MSKNFRLPSLQLGTTFDEPMIPLDVPGVLGKGSVSALCILDGANRAPLRLSRLVRPVGLLGIKLSEPGVGVRVTMRLISDELSTQMWDKHMFRSRGERPPSDEEYVAPDVNSNHRLVLVTAQGRPRALAMLALRRNDEDGTVRQVISFEVGADEIGESGLVMVGLEHPDPAPGWTARKELEDSLLGICVGRMMIDPIDKPLVPHVSTGRPGVGGGVEMVPATPGFFVVNPGAGQGAVEVSLAARGAGGERLLGRRAKVKHPFRYVRERNEDRRAGSAGIAHVEAVDLDGHTVLETDVAQGSNGQHQFTLPAGAGPVYVRARKVFDSDEPASVNWGVKVGPAS